MNKLLYISTALPTEEVKRLQEKQISFSSNALLPISVFHGNILSGLQKQYEHITALCGVPINRKIYNLLRYKSKNIQKGSINFKIPGFFNLSGLKQATVIIKFYFNILAWILKNKKHNRNIIIDGTFFTALFPLWLIKKVFKVNTTAILVDYYNFMDPNGQGKVQKLYYKLLECVDNFIFVTEHLQQLVNKDGKPYMIMEGLVVESSSSQAQTPEDVCIYAGGLHKIYGVDNLIEAFTKTNLPVSLHLYGNGKLLDFVKQASEKDPRIQYKGIVSHDEILEIEKKAKLLINPRPVYGELDTRFNFPSKLMEYMQSGRPVITTRLLGIPTEYDNRMFFFDGDSPDDIKAGIEKVLSLPEEELTEFAQKARDFVNENKNAFVVGKRIFEFINKE